MPAAFGVDRDVDHGRAGRLHYGRDTHEKLSWLVFAAMQHDIWSWVGNTSRRIEFMPGTAVFFATLAALVAAKCAARIAVNSGHFDGLPRPSQLD
jgi:hypothetical protein